MAASHTGWPGGTGGRGGDALTCEFESLRTHLHGGRTFNPVAPLTWRDEPGGPPTLPSEAAAVRWRLSPSAALTPRH